MAWADDSTATMLSRRVQAILVQTVEQNAAVREGRDIRLHSAKWCYWQALWHQRHCDSLTTTYRDQPEEMFAIAPTHRLSTID